MSKEVSKEIHTKAAPFIKWLSEAEEETSEEEEEDEDDDEVSKLLYLIVMWRGTQRGSTELMRCASSCILLSCGGVRSQAVQS